MLLHQKILVHINKKFMENYKNVEIIHVNKDMYYVDAYDLLPNSNKKVLVRCDNCGEIITIKRNDYQKCIDKNKGEYYCKKCKKYHTRKTVKDKYGVDNISKLNDVKQKKKETCNKNFGCDYPMQSKVVYNKSKETMLNKYGVEHNLQRKNISDKVKIANAKVRSQKGTIISSKAQRHICKLLNGKLNYPFKFYNLDILLDNNIYIEYNGSGHNLNVKLNQITQEEFDKKETIRYKLLKDNGYKVIIFDNLSDKLPPDNIIIDLIEICKNILNNNNNWVKVNLDTLEIITKQSLLCGNGIIK